MSLTHAGRLLAYSLAGNMAQIEQALARLRWHDHPDSLTLTVSAELAQGWLNRRLPALLALLPCARLTLLSSHQADTVAPKPSGVTLCYGYGEWIDRNVALISTDTVIAVAAPAFVRHWQFAPPVPPEHLLDLPLLGYTRRSWGLWLGAAHLPTMEPVAIATFDNVANLLDAAATGLGAGLSRKLLASDAIRDGKLVVLSNHATPTQYNLYATWPDHCAEQAEAVVAAVRRLARESLDDPQLAPRPPAAA